MVFVVMSFKYMVVMGACSSVIHLTSGFWWVLFRGKPFLSLYYLHGFDYCVVMTVCQCFMLKTVCEENNGCNECLPFFFLNPFSRFLCPLHTLDLTILIGIVEMEIKMEHLILMAAGFIDTIFFRKIPNIYRT